MKIAKVYSKYKIPPNSQEHMLRVAAVGNIICKNWKEKGVINIDKVTDMLLIHDIAKIIDFDLDKFPIDVDKFSHLLKQEEKNNDFWKTVQKEFIKTYGKDEHKATLKIAKELGLEEKSIAMLDQMPKINLQNKIPENNWELKVCWYSDLRVAPYGTTSIKKRINDLIKRQKTKGFGASEIKRLEGIGEYCFDLEKQLQQNVTISLVSIKQSMVQSVSDSFLLA